MTNNVSYLCSKCAYAEACQGLINPCSLCAHWHAVPQVIALIESLSSATTQDAAKQEGDIQQALTSLATQQPISLELHGKLAKAALQAGATAAAMQAATALLAAGLPQGRIVQDVLDPADAPGLSAADWPWLSVAALVLGQVHTLTFSPCMCTRRCLTQFSNASSSFPF